MGFRRGRGSAALRAKLTALVVVSLCLRGAVATNFKVGDSTGWTFSDYTTWASGKTFRVGDTLEFVYNSAHNVVEVTKSDYDSCSAGNATPYTDGDTKIELKTTGSKYFICSVPGHCSEGMKLAVNVVAAAAATPTSSPTPSTPSNSSTPSAPKSSPTPSTPSSPTTPSTPNPNNSTTPPPGSSSFVTLPPSLWTLSAILGLLSIFIRTL
ncbi:hypothetical protein KP509_35G022000 [Ceratopteris richardii]|uniref:Phytocyanin domain-containing protein n=1 Tax=Ceratopteris richardii TaxID=49495 RepID=A0A8T2QF54_CERRI|nr:hypothetical protein KP509_35G022000 [Ceratopteris richardii]